MKLSLLHTLKIYNEEEGYLAGKINLAKKSKEKSQNKLAPDLKMSAGGLSNVINGRRGVSLKKVKNFKKAGIHVDPFKIPEADRDK